MTIDQEQTTPTTETPSSEGTNSSETQDQTSNTSTTDPSRIDLGEDDAGGDQTQQAEDTRTDEEKAADAARAELFGAPAEDAPYEIEGLPEGMEIDKAALDAVTPVARELGLSSKGLSKIAQAYAEKVLPGVSERTTAAIEQSVIAQRKAWEDDALAAVKANGSDLKNKAGEVLSFDAKDVGAVRATAAKALDQLAPAGFREWLQETGLSVNPMMLAFAYQAGRRIAEDTEIETTERGDKRGKSRVEKYYPSTS